MSGCCCFFKCIESDLSTRRICTKYFFAFSCVFLCGFLVCKYFDVDLAKQYDSTRQTKAPKERFEHQQRVQPQTILPDVSYRRPLLNKHAIAQINKKISSLPIEQQPLEILIWVSRNFPGKWAQVTSFGMSGIAITHMIRAMTSSDTVPVITVDTLHLFPETYALIDEARRHFGLGDGLHVYRTREAATRAEFEVAFGPFLWRADPPLYDYVSKVRARASAEPMRCSRPRPPTVSPSVFAG